MARLGHRLAVRAAWFPRGLLALGEATLHCWPIIALAAAAPLILALSGQGRQAFHADTFGVTAYVSAAFSVLMVTMYARLTLDTHRSRARPRRARLYAFHTVPQLMAATAIFALPLLLRYATPLLAVAPGAEGAEDSVWGSVILLELVAPIFTLVMFGYLSSSFSDAPLGPSEWAPLVLVVVIYYVVLLTTDEQATFTKYLGLVVPIVAVNWWLPASYLQSADVRHERLLWAAWGACLYAALLVGFALYLGADPSEHTRTWGPGDVLTVVLLAALSAGFMLDFMLWGVSRTRWGTRNPLLVSALRLCVLGAIAWRLLTGSFGDTEVRATTVSDAARPTLNAYLDQWLAARKGLASTAHPYPVFIVAAEGGGIRAGYWTATVLGALQDAQPAFAPHVLALSGVSGGSVGAGVFAALVANDGAPPSGCTQGYAACARAVTGADLLSAPLASMLISEPLHRLFFLWPAGDRAAELERALEHAWTAATGTQQLSAPFAPLGAGGMLMLPNATSATTAQRLVISSVDAGTAFGDARVLDARAFTASTATLLSARFPGISPAALYTEQTPVPRTMRIVDGGFADNSGALTATDVLAALSAAVRRAGLEGRFHPVVLAITNGAAPVDATESIASGSLRTLTAGALFDPVLTMDEARGVASRQHASQLKSRVASLCGTYLDGFRLRHEKADLPLGWMLAEPTARIIDSRLAALQAEPAGDFQRVQRLLDGEAPSRCAKTASK